MSLPVNSIGTFQPSILIQKIFSSMLLFIRGVQVQGVEGGSARDGTYTEWEGHLFAILRQNIAHIGAHFAQVYPKHDTV